MEKGSLLHDVGTSSDVGRLGGILQTVVKGPSLFAQSGVCQTEFAVLPSPVSRMLSRLLVLAAGNLGSF